ncbi:MAG: hypothetical protein NVS3B14_04500 [Ktedonobacteraceae bacterium]
MRSVQTSRRRTWFVVGSFLTIIVFALAACGTNVGSGSTSAGSSSTTPTKTTGTTASAYGCPGTVMTTPPAPANVVLNQSNSSSTVTAHVGDVVEIELPFGQAWSGPTTSQGALQLLPPAGFALTASKVCVWRFTAQSAGTIQLNFYGKAICRKGQMCPLYIMRLPFTVAVK